MATYLSNIRKLKLKTNTAHNPQLLKNYDTMASNMGNKLLFTSLPW